jgi:hypothetical protein
MKRELDPFESKLREKLQGKAYFPEDILWKRLNDELVRSDQVVYSQKRYWILGTALLVLLSLSTGYFIGLNQRESAPLAKKTSVGLRKKTKIAQQLSEKNNKVDLAKMSYTDNENKVKFYQPSTTPLAANTANTLFNDNPLKEKTNSTKVNQVEMVQTELNGNIQLIATTNENSFDPLLTVSPSFSLNGSDLAPLDFPLDRLNLLKSAKLTSEHPAFINRLQKKHFPVLLSASLGVEANSNNRFTSNQVYGTNSPFSGKEKGLTTANVRLGIQAQLGKHLEFSTGIGTSHYSTEQTLQNQAIGVDPFHHHLNFESSISSFQIHEDHLMDDPEDQEENELNFQDSTMFHLNYKISNTIKSIQVPITAGYVFQWNKFKLSMKTGLIYNHITQANQLVNISGFNPIRTNVQPQLVATSYFQLLQIGAEYPISKHASIMFSPRYTYALKSISKSTILRPNFLGMECALKFYF